jgi:hypothetical protein
MTNIEQLTQIIEKSREDQLIPFLKLLDNAQKKEIVPHLKKIAKHNNEFLQTSNGRYDYRGTTTQRNIIQIASFVCFNKVDYEKSPFPVWMLAEKVTSTILDWYCPDWYSDFVNKQATLEFIPHYLNYEWIMGMSDKGFVQPSKELLAKVMPNMIFESEKNVWTCKPENLLKRKITLDEHIWYLFEVDTNLHYSDRWLNFDKKENFGWTNTFKKYTEENRIDRNRLLLESLLASNKNFNKILSGWFIQLFTELKPEKAEILSLQKELFSILNSPHSKVVNTALDAIKKITDNDQFDTMSFLDSAPVLLSSDIKAIVAAALGIFDKIAKKHIAQRPNIVKQVCSVFVIADDDLQTKAAKIIEKYADKHDEGIKNELATYQDGMMQNARKILGSFVEDALPNKEESKSVILQPDVQQNPAEIPAINTTDDLMFLAAMAFDNNETWHIDLLPASLIKFQKEIKGANISRFEPALQRALKMMGRDFRSNNGYLDHMLAIFFIDYCIFLVRKFPGDAQILETLSTKFDQKDGATVRKWLAMDATKSYLKGWDNHYHDPYYLVYKQFLLSALQKIKRADSLALLSTPTHQPAWILPEIFIDRLQHYQQNNQEPGDIDLQMAISRCDLKKAADVAKIASEKLSGEYREICLFLFSDGVEPKGPFTNNAAWMAASLARTPKKTYNEFANFSYYKLPFSLYTGQITWRSVDEEYTNKRYDYKLREYVPVTDRRKIIHFDSPVAKKDDTSFVKKIFSKFTAKPKEDAALIYDFLNIKAQFFSVEHNDIKRVLLMIPNNPEAFLPHIARRCLQYPSLLGETDKKIIIAVLQVLYEIWADFGEMAHFFVATSMLASDKTVAKIAAEIWIKATNENKIDQSLLGRIIGTHEKIEFVPLKRFTDLLTQNMFRVSGLHNKKLQQFIESILVELPDAPIKNLKKLLEIYAETLSTNNTNVSNADISRKLNNWKTASSLQKKINHLLE